MTEISARLKTLFFSVCQLDDRQPTYPRNRFTLALSYISTLNVASPPSEVWNREFPVLKQRRKKRRSEKCVWEENIRGKATTAAKERKYVRRKKEERKREREKRFIDFLNVIFMARHFKGFSSSALALLSLTRIHIHTQLVHIHTPEGWWKSGHGKTFFSALSTRSSPAAKRWLRKFDLAIFARES